MIFPQPFLLELLLLLLYSLINIIKKKSQHFSKHKNNRQNVFSTIYDGYELGITSIITLSSFDFSSSINHPNADSQRVLLNSTDGDCGGIIESIPTQVPGTLINGVFSVEKYNDCDIIKFWDIKYYIISILYFDNTF
jgi:hypothetical protein